MCVWFWGKRSKNVRCSWRKIEPLNSSIIKIQLNHLSTFKNKKHKTIKNFCWKHLWYTNYLTYLQDVNNGNSNILMLPCCLSWQSLHRLVIFYNVVLKVVGQLEDVPKSTSKQKKKKKKKKRNYTTINYKQFYYSSDSEFFILFLQFIS